MTSDAESVISDGGTSQCSSRSLPLRKSYVSTTTESEISHRVRDLSLDDVIAQRKILVPKQPSRKLKCEPKSTAAGEGALGLDKIIQNRKKTIQDRPNMNISLDQIIQSSKIKKEPEEATGKATVANSSRGQKRKREEELDAVGLPFLRSPLEVVNSLTAEGLLIEYQVGKMQKKDNKEHFWRASFKCGQVHEKCDSIRKVLAREGAALEFLKRIKEKRPHLKIPHCKIPEALFYDPAVLTRLAEVTTSMGVGVPRFETVQTQKDNKHDYFTTTYYIGEDEFVAGDYNLQHSQILAAKDAYNTYSGRKCRRDNFFVGNATLDDSNFICCETEAVHFINVETQRNLHGSLKDLAGDDEEEIFVDDDGNMFVRSSDNSNKLRRLSRAGMDELLRQKLHEMAGNGPAAADGFASQTDDEDHGDF